MRFCPVQDTQTSDVLFQTRADSDGLMPFVVDRSYSLASEFLETFRI